jgi:Styrene monooxygenase A putative substrate binding domain
MRKVTIVGAGQAGLQLGIGLRQKNYEVRVVSNRTPEDIRAGRVLSSQCMFDNALQAERGLGINTWEAECPNIDGIRLILRPPDGGSEKALDWAYKLDRPAQAVDQRVKIPGWMKQFQGIGGELVIHEAGIADLEDYCRDSDLVIVASGKNETSRLFERDAARSPFDKPARALALTYVTDMTCDAPFSAVTFNLLPGIGEYFVLPALTTSGACHIMIFEGIPGGPMDCWQDVHTADQHLARSKEILEKFMPWEAERCRNVALTDANGTLAGQLTPTVRKPVGKLPSGAQVLGMADTVVLNDPITGQGSNNAAKCARIYLKSILDHSDAPFDGAWMQRTFETYWDYAQWVTGWTNAMLMPPPPHVMKILICAQKSARIGRAFVNGFDDPRTFFPWLADPAEADRFIGDEASQVASS